MLHLQAILASPSFVKNRKMMRETRNKHRICILFTGFLNVILQLFNCLPTQCPHRHRVRGLLSKKQIGMDKGREGGVEDWQQCVDILYG